MFSIGSVLHCEITQSTVCVCMLSIANMPRICCIHVHVFVTLDATSDVTLGNTSDVTLDAASDETLDDTSDVTLDASSDVTHDITSDVAMLVGCCLAK